MKYHNLAVADFGYEECLDGIEARYFIEDEETGDRKAYVFDKEFADLIVAAIGEYKNGS